MSEQLFRRNGSRKIGRDKTFTNIYFLEEWNLKEEEFGNVTKCELTNQGISPYSLFNLCRKCQIWLKNKPQYCTECHGRTRFSDRMGSKAKGQYLTKHQS